MCCSWATPQPYTTFCMRVLYFGVSDSAVKYDAQSTSTWQYNTICHSLPACQGHISMCLTLPVMEQYFNCTFLFYCTLLVSLHAVYTSAFKFKLLRPLFNSIQFNLFRVQSIPTW
jgi:hypothetical protein